jgi:hypothetical protein
LSLTPLPPVTHPCFELTHPYFELVYAPSVGPTAVLLARSLGRLLAANVAGTSICASALAIELGLKSGTGPIGKRSTLNRSIDRLAHLRIVRWLGDSHLGVHTSVPVVSDRVLGRLPPGARAAHEQIVRVVDLREHGSLMPQRRTAASESDTTR